MTGFEGGLAWAPWRWVLGIVIVFVLSGISTFYQSMQIENEQLKRERLAAFDGRSDGGVPAEICDRLDHNTPVMLYLLLFWVVFALERQISETRRLRAAVARQSPPPLQP
jgi:hypothetical protein